ncbi:transcription factor 19 [Paramormyrops kingsleyae]|uniref:Transcription factor 19 (SC1), like n=1 Tax=Paramormyrops kingsleyae TaxID=1676925 RepID=A0A3B3T789_9TELE|nr:transcription factor 19 [Paramormyrops kingsleyae]XP_023665739.1 transcription factor 19 [Paramormyrops kingsleyae]
MLSKVQPCFQLLRIGSSTSPGSAVSEAARDLYTFRPALSNSVFRLGRKAELCDVTLQSATISRIHAELFAQRELDCDDEEGWRVHVKDRSSSGTWVNDLRLQPDVQWELSDGDTLTFGGQSDSGNPEFYFLFQKVLVRPSEFDAITVPKAGSFTSDLQDRIRTSLEPKTEPNLDLSPLSLKRATVILNSIGSISKMNGSCWTFKRIDNANTNPDPLSPPSLVSPSTPPPIPSTTAISVSRSVPASSKSRRKSAHTVLLEDDSSDEMRNSGRTLEGRRKSVGKRRRLCKSECEVFHPPQSEVESYGSERFEFRSESKNPSRLDLPLQSKAKLSHLFSVSGQKHSFSLKIKMDSEDANSSPGLWKEYSPFSPSARGRRRAHSSPAYSPLLVRGESYTIISPSSKQYESDRGDAGEFVRLHVNTGKRRGRPRKHPPAPPLSSHSSFHFSSETVEGERARAEEPCASGRCRMPQQDTVQWIQCDDCDAWYHIDCVQRDTGTSALDTSADFHCGCQ